MTQQTPAEKAKTAAAKACQKIGDGELTLELVMAITFFAVFLSLLLKLAFKNVEPFVYLIGGTLPTASGIPIVGWAWDFFNLVYTAFGALIAWGFINVCESLWIFIAVSTRAKRNAIKRAQKLEAQLQPAEGVKESAQVRRVKRDVLKVPFFFIEWSPVIAIAALTIDAIVNWNRYPVIESWSLFWGGLMINRVIGVDFENLKEIGWNLISCEILVVLLILTWQWIDTYRSAE